MSELRSILVATGVSDAKMEEGSLRVDANVSVHHPGEPLGTRCEIKNLNSLRSLGRAIDYEVTRQIDLIEAGETVRQETRHWNEDDGRTHTLRVKEEAEDYRYFPEPDLVPLDPGAEWVQRVDAALPALPAARRAALAAAAGGEGNGAVAIAVERGLDTLALDTIAAGAEPGRVLTHVEHNLAVDGAADLAPERLAALVKMETGGELTATQAKAVLAEMVSSGDDPAAIAEAKGFEAMGADALSGRGRRRHRRPPRRVGPLRRRRRQGPGQAHRVLRRPGDEGHEGPGRRQGRHRAAAPARRVLTAARQSA